MDLQTQLDRVDIDGILAARPRLARRALRRLRREQRSSLTDFPLASFETGLIVDLFAGGGGWTTGAENAMGRPVDIAVNHNASAIAMHMANHPETQHYIEDVFHVDPLEATGGRPVAILIASPDCRHFSRAKGAPLKNRKIRGLAWVVVRWCKLTRPRLVLVENVSEIQTWGRLDKDGRPSKKHAGEYFRKWVREIESLGYRLEYKELCAADYGVPTIRKRLFIICRRIDDGQPITWPEPTHGPGRKHPYRTAAECIDWDLPVQSIFERSRPLATNTLRRIAKGIVRYVIENPRPFLVTCNHAGDEFRGQALDEPMRTITAARDAHGLVSPLIVGAGGPARSGEPRSLAAPFNTITCKDDRRLVAPVLVGIDNKSNGEADAWSPEAPLRTITTENRHAVATPFMVRTAHGEQDRSGKRRGQGVHSLTQPLPTQTASRDFALVAPHITKFRQNPGVAPIDQALPPITAGDGSCRPAGAAHAMGMVAATMVHTGYGERDGQEPRALDLERPLGTVVAGGVKHAVVTAELNGLVDADRSIKASPVDGFNAPADTPLQAATEQRRHFIAAAYIAQQNTGVVGREACMPLSTILSTGSHQNVVRAALMSHFYSSSETGGAGEVDKPMKAITAQGGHHAIVEAQLSQDEIEFRARRVAEFLRRYYRPDKSDRRRILTDPLSGTVHIGGHDYRIVDIGLRMLRPRELYRAQGFPEHYKIDPVCKYHTRKGTKYGRLPQSEQVAKCGNSVCPPLAEAIVRANAARYLGNLSRKVA